MDESNVIKGDMIDYSLTDNDYSTINAYIANTITNDKQTVKNNETIKHEFEYDIYEGVIIVKFSIQYTYPIPTAFYPTLTKIDIKFLGADRDGGEYLKDVYINVNKLNIDYVES